MADRVSPGQPIPRSAVLWNNIIESANDYARRSRLGEAGGSVSLPNPTDVVKIKNSTGGHIRAGEVLEITGFLLGNVRRTELWFDGDTPDATHPFAIALQDIPSTAIDRAQVSGVCVALVNVTDAAHGYAYVEDAEKVAQSAVTGPLRILHKPTGTGEKICAVLFEFGATDTGPHWIEFELTEALATSDASADADVVSGYGPGLPVAETAVTVLNLATDTESVYMYEGAIGAIGLAIHKGGTNYQIFQLNCVPA